MNHKKYRIKIEEIGDLIDKNDYSFPKYTRQLLNLANQNSGGTKSRNVGQLSELFPKFKEEVKNSDITIDDWKTWYLKEMPGSKEKAVELVKSHITLLKDAINQINDEMIVNWIDELLFDKTFIGMQAQYFILAKIAQIEGTKDFRLAGPDEESKNIDGYVNGMAYQIKPETFDFKKYQVKGDIPCKVIKYKKESDSIIFEYLQ